MGSEFYVFCSVYCDIIIQHKLRKCTFYKLIFYFLIFMSSTCFEPESSSLERRLYIQLRYGTLYMHQHKQSVGKKSVFDTSIDTVSNISSLVGRRVCSIQYRYCVEHKQSSREKSVFDTVSILCRT